MKIRSALALTGLAIGFIFPTFARQKDAIDPKIDQQIRALASKFDEAYNKNDPAAVAALYTEDAVRFNADNLRFHGRKAIEKSFADVDFKRWHSYNFFTNVDRVTAVRNQVRSNGRRPRGTA
jgi:nuclear transport factor 2 (NTF2) superfamily protein